MRSLKMSDGQTRRIRAQRSPANANALGFVLDAPLQTGVAHRAAALDPEAPLARALFTIDGVQRAEVAGATIWVRKHSEASWDLLKPAIAAAIRAVLDESDAPMGTATPVEKEEGPEVILYRAVEELLERQVNPSIAAHGGHIAVDKVEGTAVFLRMSGGCQGCAASSATLRQGVERMLRAALPEIGEIVDVTDHAAGENPFYDRDTAQLPVFHRPIPPGVISWEQGQVTVDPEYLASRLGITPDALREGLRRGDVVGVTETGMDEDAGKTRIVLRTTTRAWAAEVLSDGSAREIPPPRLIEAAGRKSKSGRPCASISRRPRPAVQDRYIRRSGSCTRHVGTWIGAQGNAGA